MSIAGLGGIVPKRGQVSINSYSFHQVVHTTEYQQLAVYREPKVMSLCEVDDAIIMAKSYLEKPNFWIDQIDEPKYLPQYANIDSKGRLTGPVDLSNNGLIVNMLMHLELLPLWETPRVLPHAILANIRDYVCHAGDEEAEWLQETMGDDMFFNMDYDFMNASSIRMEGYCEQRQMLNVPA